MNTTPDIISKTVTLRGLKELMFDRYAGDNKTQLPVEAKMYFLRGTKKLCIPALNLMSFLSAKNNTSVPKLMEAKVYKNVCDAMQSFVEINPDEIAILRNGKQIEFHGFEDGEDKEAGIYVAYHVARLPKGIPNPKERPVLRMPWSITFNLKLYKNDVVNETYLNTAFTKGGIAIGLGTFRGSFGKFAIEKWE